MDSDEQPTGFAARFDRALKMADMSIQQVARKLDGRDIKGASSAGHLYDLRGGRSDPRLGLVEELAEILAVPPAWLASGAQPNGATPEQLEIEPPGEDLDPDDHRLDRLLADQERQDEDLEEILGLLEDQQRQIEELQASLKAAGLPIYRRAE